MKLTEDIKKMLAGLAYQDAGDYLSINEKMKALGGDNSGNRMAASITAGSSEKTAPRKRIAFASNGKGYGAPLNYAIDTCQRLNADIDLLTYGLVDNDRYREMETRFNNAGIRCRWIQIDADTVNATIDYIVKHPSVMYLIASTENDVARELVENVLPANRRRLGIPVVLIEEQKVSRLHSQSAA